MMSHHQAEQTPAAGAAAPAGQQPLLAVENLGVSFDTRRGEIRAVEDVSFELSRGERLAIVGESGSGKTVTALAIMRLIGMSGGRITSGSVRLKGVDLVGFSGRDIRKIRGAEMAMVFQDPMTSLNPLITIGRQISETLTAHLGISARDARRRSIELIDLVRIPNAAEQFGKYPHEFSGGMRQRVMIAMALSCGPSLLIADEPTTALDVTIQAEILGLLDSLCRDTGTSVMIITHNLGIVAQFADRIVVMYAGRVAESAPTAQLFAAPAHPYTAALLRATPRVDRSRGERLESIPGQLPSPETRGAGCSFQPRCSVSVAKCVSHRPPLALVAHSPEQAAACWLANEDAKGVPAHSMPDDTSSGPVTAP
jgi:oligopeptide/dipeptide ABC transporter ATP-binding protein